MKRVSVGSLRGGAGATSLATMLGCALNALGESVVIVDLNESDLLRLHFNISYDDVHGWAAAQAQGTPWHEHAFRVRDQLMVVPYGRNGLDGQVPVTQETACSFWTGASARLREHYSWVIFDVPSGANEFTPLRAQCDIDVVVAQPDMGSHVLLLQKTPEVHSYLLANKLDPTKQLASDILLDWRQRYRDVMIPISVVYDEHIHDAFAHKLPVTVAYPDSSGAQDALSFATWCLAQEGAN